MNETDIDQEQETRQLKQKITVLLVDDHAVVRNGFRRVLEDDPELMVVGESGEGMQAVRMAKELRPTVVLLDCSLPGMDGLVVAERIVQACPGTAVLICSMHTEESWVRRARQAGANGYIFKSAMDLDLPLAIKQVAAGELLFGDFASQPTVSKAGENSGLSLREMEVLQLIVNGKSNKQIARQLNLSANTVGVHRANIMKTLRIHRTAELVAFAIRKGLVHFP